MHYSEWRRNPDTWSLFRNTLSHVQRPSELKKFIKRYLNNAWSALKSNRDLSPRPLHATGELAFVWDDLNFVIGIGREIHNIWQGVERGSLYVAQLPIFKDTRKRNIQRREKSAED